MESVEILQIDTRYENLRLKNKKQESNLLSSIMEQGVLEPIYIIRETGNDPILIDGFKRYRCAKRLNIKTLPATVLDSKEAPGIVKFLRLNSNKCLTQIEQACLVDELHHHHEFSSGEIASYLEKSPAWVSLRLGIMSEMSDSVREKIMAGQFPLHNYMYTLGHFKRLKSVKKKEIDDFINITSNKGLSTRDIDMLAKGYFKGGENLKSQIGQGNLDWTLRQLKRQEKEKQLPDDGLNDLESKVLSQLNWTYTCILRLPGILGEIHFENKSFFIKGSNLAKKILDIKDNFISSLENFYDKSR